MTFSRLSAAAAAAPPLDRRLRRFLLLSLSLLGGEQLQRRHVEVRQPAGVGDVDEPGSGRALREVAAAEEDAAAPLVLPRKRRRGGGGDEAGREGEASVTALGLIGLISSELDRGSEAELFVIRGRRERKRGGGCRGERGEREEKRETKEAELREGRPRTIERSMRNLCGSEERKTKTHLLVTNSLGRLSTHFQIYDNEEECSSCPDEEELKFEPAGQGKGESERERAEAAWLPRAKSER